MPRNALVMPKMSMTMDVGTMVFWLKNVGETVVAGEPICEVTTDKVDMEVEATSSGVIVELCAEQGDIVPVGAPIAFIESDTEDLLAGLFAQTHTEKIRTDAAPVHPVATPDREPVPAARTVLAVPAARVFADRHGLDLAGIAPTGAWNTVRLTDVELALEMRVSPEPLASSGALATGATTFTCDSTRGSGASYSVGRFVALGALTAADLDSPNRVLAHLVRAISRGVRSNVAALRTLSGGIEPGELHLTIRRESVQIDGFDVQYAHLAELLNPAEQTIESLVQQFESAKPQASTGPRIVVQSFLGTGITRATIPLPDAVVFGLTIGDVVNGHEPGVQLDLVARTSAMPASIAAALLQHVSSSLAGASGSNPRGRRSSA